MKTQNFFLMIVSLLIPLSLLAQTPNITLQRASEGTISVTVGLATAGNIQIDWGDGNLVTATAGTTNNGVKITGTVLGTNIVGLYGPITSLICTDAALIGIDVLNAPTLLKLDVPRNNLTALNVSNCTNIYRVSIYQNSFDACGLDYFFLSLPITLTGTIVTYNNPGSHTCKTSIATEKGWTLGSGSPVGDGTGCPATFENINIRETFHVSYSDNRLLIITNEISHNANINIYSISGKKVLSKEIRLHKNNELPVTLQKGIYFVSLSFGSKNITTKFIVN